MSVYTGYQKQTCKNGYDVPDGGSGYDTMLARILSQEDYNDVFQVHREKLAIEVERGDQLEESIERLKKQIEKTHNLDDFMSGKDTHVVNALKKENNTLKEQKFDYMKEMTDLRREVKSLQDELKLIIDNTNSGKK